MLLQRTSQAREVLTPCLVFVLLCEKKSRHVKSQPTELVQESESDTIKKRRMIMNIFEWEEDAIRPLNGTMKDGTNEQDQHSHSSAPTPAAVSIVSCMLTRVVIFYIPYHVLVADNFSSRMTR